MTVYVDRLRTWETPLPYKTWCHMLADTTEELHAMAAALGLKRSWYQGPPRHRHPHYDLVPTKRALAIKAGAVPVSDRDAALVIER